MELILKWQQLKGCSCSCMSSSDMDVKIALLLQFSQFSHSLIIESSLLDTWPLIINIGHIMLLLSYNITKNNFCPALFSWYVIITYVIMDRTVIIFLGVAITCQYFARRPSWFKNLNIYEYFIIWIHQRVVVTMMSVWCVHILLKDKCLQNRKLKQTAKTFA